MKTVCKFLVAGVVLWSTLGFAQETKGLSESDIVRLRGAGLSDETIVHQIQHDGVSFQTDASTTIRLKAAGISETVINALLTGGTGQDSGTHDSALVAKQLYAEQKYDQLRQYLQQQLTEHPERTDASKLRSLLILASLRQDDLGAAKSQLAILDQDKSSGGQTYAKKVRAAVTGYETAQAQKRALLLALNSFDARRAKQIIASLGVSDAQKALLGAQLAVYQGRYDEARDLISKVDLDAAPISSVMHKIDEAQADYARVALAIDAQLYSPLIPSDCINARNWLKTREKDFSQISLELFLNKAQEFFKIAPLNERALDLVFFSAVLSLPSEQVEQIGDKLLFGKGSLALPFYASDRFFEVVIDSDKRRIYSRDDSHVFSVRYVLHQWSMSLNNLKAGPTNEHIESIEPFDLGFDEITAIDQHIARAGWGTWMGKGTYALKFEPRGLAPAYAFMSYIDCTVGRQAGKQATRNVGAYLAHVIGRKDIKVSLDDEKDKGGLSTLDAVMIGAAAGYLGATGNLAAQQMVLQAADSKIATDVRVAQEQSKQWAGLANLQAQALDGAIFKDLEATLQL